MSKEKSEKGVRNVPITVRLNEGEHEKLKMCIRDRGKINNIRACAREIVNGEIIFI